MILVRVAPHGLAVEIDDRHYIVTGAYVGDRLDAGFNYAGDRAWWSVADLYRIGADLLVRTARIHSHEGADDRTEEAAFVSHDGGRTWSAADDLRGLVDADRPASLAT